MSAGRLRARWAALTGTGGAASVALALLVLGCVFVSVAGPRESLGFRSRALQSSLAATTPLVRSVLVTTSYTDFTVPFQGPITAGTLAEARGQLRANLARTGLPLAPAAADWSTMTTAYDIAGGAARSAFDGPDPPELAVSYSDALSRHARLIAGSFPGAGAGRRLPIAVTASTARRFGLHVGSRLTMDEARLTVAGIVRPVHPGAAFWTANQNAAMPAPPVTRGPAYWTGTVFMGAAEVGAMQSYFKLFDGQLEWDFPLALGGVNADQAVTLHNELNRASLRAGGLRLADSTVNVDVGSALGDRLLGFITADAALADLLSLLYVSLAVLGVIVVLLGARMLAEHRRPDFGLMRARGASRPQLAAPANAAWAEAFQESQRQTAEAHIAFQRSMAETHAALKRSVLATV